MNVRAFGLAVLVSFVFTFGSRAAPATLPPLNVRFETASATVEGNRLIVSTGAFTRTWQLTERGLGTDSVAREASAPATPPARPDWDAEWLAGPARLTRLIAERGDDDGFTSAHLRILAEFHYEAAGVDARYEIWAFPGGPGVRTQLWFRGGPASGTNANASPVVQTEFVPAAGDAIGIGYYNDTQHRNEPGTPILREERVAGTAVDWANILCRESGRRGIAVVKESHKCVNQPGVNTGDFRLTESGVAVTGAGLQRSDLRADRWRWAWATWVIGYDPQAPRGRELAIKAFDRVRYPVRLDRDVYAKANTWGSGATGNESVSRASEREVLAEIDAVADLGLDALQIDDGWQKGRMTPKPAAAEEWEVRPDWYPNGWAPVVARARERHIELGLWMAARAPYEAIERNYRAGHFTTWKLDFASLRTYDAVDEYLSKARRFIATAGHAVRVNWDVTENAPRFGYFWARECGNVWLANRKPSKPVNVAARPALMLRDAWELTRYVTAVKFELPVVNFRQVDAAVSDAHLYPDEYSVALALPGVPVFFQTTRLLTEEQRARIRAFLTVYKAIRRELFASTVLPIGERPDGAQWSGFQWCAADSAASYVLIFRERGNPEAQHPVALHGITPGATVRITNLQTGSVHEARVDANGTLPFLIEQPASVLFARIETDRLNRR